MATDKAQLPLAAPQANRRGCLAIGAITAGRMCVHLIALFVVCQVLCSGFPVAWRLFEKEEMRVPALTAQTYSTYHWMVHYWFLAIPAVLVVDGLILAGLESLRDSYRWLARVWFAFVLVLAILYLGFLTACITVPLDTLVPIEGDPADMLGNPAPGLLPPDETGQQPET